MPNRVCGVPMSSFTTGRRVIFSASDTNKPVSIDVTAIALCQIDIIALFEKAHSARARIAQLPERFAPARADHRWPASGMLELISGIVGRFDDDHHRGGAALEAPPRHRPAFNHITLHLGRFVLL